MIFRPGESRKIIHCNLMQSCLGVIGNPNVAVVIHNTRSCSHIVWEAFKSLGEKYRMVTEETCQDGMLFCTGLTNKDAVFGATEKLRRCLIDIVEEKQPEMILVICGCVPGVIGDDTESICQEVEADTGTPVVLLPGHGFMVPGLIDTVTSISRLLFDKFTIPCKPNPSTCIVSGLSPAYSSKDEYGELMGILHLLGFTKILCPPVGMDKESYKSMGEASCVISFVRGAFSEKASIEVGTYMAEKLQVPFLNWNHVNSPQKSEQLFLEAAKLFDKVDIMSDYCNNKNNEIQQLLVKAKDKVRGKSCYIRLGISRQAEKLIDAIHLLQAMDVSDIHIILSDMIPSKEETQLENLLESNCGRMAWHRSLPANVCGIRLSTIPFDLRKCDELLIPSCLGYNGWIRFIQELGDTPWDG